MKQLHRERVFPKATGLTTVTFLPEVWAPKNQTAFVITTLNHMHLQRSFFVIRASAPLESKLLWQKVGTADWTSSCFSASVKSMELPRKLATTREEKDELDAAAEWTHVPPQVHSISTPMSLHVHHQQTCQLTYHHKCTAYQHLCHFMYIISKHINSRTTTSAQHINICHFMCKISKHINSRTTTSAQRINTYVTSCTWTISKHINSRTTASAQRINTYITSCTWTISKHINSRTTTSAQRINTYVTSCTWVNYEANRSTHVPPQVHSVSIPMSLHVHHQQTYQLTCDHKCTPYQHLCGFMCKKSKHINSRTTTSAQRISTYVTSCTWTISKHINSRTTASAQRINTYVTSLEMNHEERTIKNGITPPPPRTPQPTPTVSTPMSLQWRSTTIEDLVEHLHVTRTKWNTSSCKTASMYETHVQNINMCKLSGAPSPRVT